MSMGTIKSVAEDVLWSLYVGIIVVSVVSIVASYILSSMLVASIGIMSLVLVLLLRCRWWLYIWSMLGLCVIVYWLGLLIFGWYPDLSYDGNAYHLEAMKYLFDGIGIYSLDFSSRRLDYYPKNIELLFAFFGAWYQDLSIARISKLVVWLVVGMLSVSVITKSVIHSTYQRWIVIIILLFHPVVISQRWTLYIDDLLYLIMLSVGLLWYDRQYMLSIAMIALLMWSKVSFFFFWWLLFVLLCSYEYIRQDRMIVLSSLWIRKRIIVVSCFVVSLVIVSSWSYVANIIRTGNPFYLVLWWSNDLIAWIQKTTPPIIAESSLIHKVWYIYTSLSVDTCRIDSCVTSPDAYSLRWWFNIFRSYINLASPDAMIWPYGVLWGWMMVWVLFLGILILCTTKTYYTIQQRYILLYGLLCLVVSPIPYGRYVVIFYVLPLLIVWWRKSRWCQNIVLWIYIVNCLLIVGWKSWYVVRVSWDEYRQMSMIQTFSPHKIVWYEPSHIYHSSNRLWNSMYNNILLSRVDSMGQLMSGCDNPTSMTYSTIGYQQCDNGDIVIKAHQWLSVDSYLRLAKHHGP